MEAAQCSIEIQRTLAKRNHDVARERRIELRIGIHIGDVVHREGDVYGDGVNIASRIQPVAGVGGICISVDVERQIHNALEVTFEKLAPIELKNVQVPMDLFRIGTAMGAAGPDRRGTSHSGGIVTEAECARISYGSYHRHLTSGNRHRVVVDNASTRKPYGAARWIDGYSGEIDRGASVR